MQFKLISIQSFPLIILTLSLSLPYSAPLQTPPPHIFCFLLWVSSSFFHPKGKHHSLNSKRWEKKEGSRGHWAMMEALSRERLTRARGESHPPSVKVALPAVFIMHRFSYPSSLEPLRSSGCGCFSKLSFTPSSLAPCSS